MGRLLLLRLAGLIAGAAFVAGCGGAQAVPQNAAMETPASPAGKSWMLPEAKNEDLIYVGDDQGRIEAYSYPKFKLVGGIASYRGEVTTGLCTDNSGNLFVPAWALDSQTIAHGVIYEFAHGGATPIQTLTDGASQNLSCAVDPTTGNLVVANADGIEIFTNAQGMPTFRPVPIGAQWLAYDSSGDLFVANGKLAVLPKGENSFANLSLNDSITASSIQWENGYLTIVGVHDDTEYEPIYRASISGTSGTIVGKTKLRTRRWDSYGGQVLVHDNIAVGAGNHHYKVDVWPYPQGGRPIMTPLTHFTLLGAAFSPAPTRSRARR